MKTLFYLLTLCTATIFLTSCERYDDEVLPVIGVYEANVVGVSGPFSVSISVDHGDNIRIDAPWDGENWAVLDADVDNEFEFEKRIKIFDQEIGDGVRIWGDGIFFDYTIQLDYTIRIDGVKYNYTLVGTKL